MLDTAFCQLHRLVWTAIVPLAVFSVFLLILEEFLTQPAIAYAVSIGLTTSTLALFLYFGKRVRWSFNYTVSPLLIVVLGLAIKIAAFVLFPVNFVSDSATYVSLANQLISENSYQHGNTYAYWPPGYPLFLYVSHLGIIPVSTSTIFIQNCLITLIASYVIFQLTHKYHSRRAAIVAISIFTFWPTGLLGALDAYKELPLMTLLLLSVYLYTQKSGFKYHFINGLVLGFCALIQPGTILFVSVFVVLNWFKKLHFTNQLSLFVCLLAGMLSAIAPWSYRNTQVFDQFVMISTNGGSNMYRANNEIATGGYIAKGAIDISHLSELEQDKRGKELAIEWIKNNPVDFFYLSFIKMTKFLGDDSTGIYSILKRSAQQPIGEIPYYGLKLGANTFWLLLWLIIFFCREKLYSLITSDHLIATLSLSFLYFFTVHSVFESNAKYHLPAIPMFFILVAILIAEIVETFDNG
ncbi:hypothetical protein [Thalassotalea euphylliae]|uniref:Glycosyltransferase RgtA/B/C/D-like domain-containing protein n=1 Tax=Thalassotalea euphylliae TaxID=1655234 RepID=A0A3E0U3F4_9GAMM|nr:hypothetical protein [Thalassotalea euphylliae]REL31117.1 hypothetical protein DXX94_10575 [Thalassotalea euphylliae]